MASRDSKIGCKIKKVMGAGCSRPGERKRLKPEAVPSVFSFACKNESSSAREQRYSKRVKCDRDHSENVSSSECIRDHSENGSSSECVVNEVVVESVQEVNVDCECYESDEKKLHDQSIQCDIGKSNRFSIEKLQSNDKMVKYYTGFENYDHFMMFFQVLGPAAHDLNLKSNLLSPQDQFFLVMIKLRQAKEDIELSYLFQVSESTVSNIIVTWINFMYFQLKEINIWPSRSVIDEYMPDDFFANFCKTRVIIDATEVPINKPQNVNAQSATFSNYKNKNTLKVMIGCTPHGTVSYISDAYCGATSDRQIIERSDLLRDLDKFQDHDSIMADRGIMVQDLFAPRNIQVNTPTMLKGKSQLEAQDVVKDRRIASKRIHVERIIGLAKTFKILKKELPQGKAILGSRIIFICFSILNFRPCIVDKYS
ncbi:uncharacterized protein LOC133204949 [Saccostrea echinata]|uniref:uncharacterized protein LOC133204949 n=1 Tax=Saccostrea echinata TaxID=191078 RepID=UPI002A7F6474|nr:uncharacterized protein LOC133204949 [Saccostrea echinata]